MHVLEQVAKLLDVPESWTTCARARNVYGHPVCWESREACKWCLQGALWRKARLLDVNKENEIVGEAEKLLADALTSLQVSSPDMFPSKIDGYDYTYIDVNDQLGFQAVKILLHTAINLRLANTRITT